eukprot:gene15750-18713_t
MTALIVQIESNPFSLNVNGKQALEDVVPEVKKEDGMTDLLVKKEEGDEEAEEEVKIMTKSKKESQKLELQSKIKSMLVHQFGEMEPVEDDPLLLRFTLDDQTANINIDTMVVECTSSELKTHLESAIKRIQLSVNPLSYNRQHDNDNTTATDFHNKASILRMTSSDPPTTIL